MKKYLKLGAVSSTEGTCDTIRVEQESKVHDSFYTTFPIRINKDIEFPASFSLTVLDSAKVVLKKYDKVSFDKHFNHPDKNKAGWFLNIKKINDTIDLVSEEH